MMKFMATVTFTLMETLIIWTGPFHYEMVIGQKKRRRKIGQDVRMKVQIMRATLKSVPRHFNVNIFNHAPFVINRTSSSSVR